MTVYYFIMALVCFLCYKAEQFDWPEIDRNDGYRYWHSSDARVLYFLVVCILIFVAGCRFNVGADYPTYYDRFEVYIKEMPSSIKNLDEPGFRILVWVASRLYYDPAAMIFLSALITCLLPLLVIFKYSDKLLFPTFLYLALGCWSGSFNGIRQYLAAAVVFCGYKSLREKNFVKYCVFVFIAFLFHRSALVCLIFYFLFNREINITNIIVLLIAVALLLYSYNRVFLVANYIMEQEYSLENAYTATRVNRLRVLAACVPSVVFLYSYFGEKKNASITFALNTVILWSAMSVLAMNSALLYRINIYTSFFVSLAIPKLIDGVSEKNRKVVTYYFVAMYLVMWWYEIYKTGSMNHFKWIWER